MFDVRGSLRLAIADADADANANANAMTVLTADSKSWLCNL
jgi:hypothetical protein